MSELTTKEPGSKITVVGIGCPPPHTNNTIRVGTNTGFIEIRQNGDLFFAGSEPVQQAIHVALNQFPEVKQLARFRNINPMFFDVTDVIKAMADVATLNPDAFEFLT